MHLQVAGIVWNIGLNLHLHFLEKVVNVIKPFTMAKSFVVGATRGLPADGDFKSVNS